MTTQILQCSIFLSLHYHQYLYLHYSNPIFIYLLPKYLQINFKVKMIFQLNQIFIIILVDFYECCLFNSQKELIFYYYPIPIFDHSSPLSYPKDNLLSFWIHLLKIIIFIAYFIKYYHNCFIKLNIFIQIIIIIKRPNFKENQFFAHSNLIFFLLKFLAH